MMHLVRFFLLLSAVSAFTPSTGGRFGVSTVTSTQQFMFSKDDKPAPLATMDEPETLSAAASTSKGGSIVKDMNTGEIREVKWQDPAMLANTNLVMDWWAALLILVPSTLILDDFFHFLPKGMFLVN